MVSQQYCRLASYPLSESRQKLPSKNMSKFQGYPVVYKSQNASRLPYSNIIF